MSDLLQVGTHCALASCNLIDFLPITCKCNRAFCRDHISPALHLCSAVHQYEPGESDSGLVKLQRCDIASCNKPSLLDPARETCEKCHRAFCVDHRYPDTHDCVSVQSEPQAFSSSSARAILQKNFGSSLSAKAKEAINPRKKVPTDPVKLAQYHKIQLMKTRHAAVPADPKDKATLPAEQRLTVSVFYEQLEKPLWFRKAISTGKAVDLLASQFNVASSNPIQLVKSGQHHESMVLRNDQILADQVDDGATLLLKKAEGESEMSSISNESSELQLTSADTGLV